MVPEEHFSMQWRNLSLQHKLTLLTAATTTVALVISAAGFLIYDLISFRRLLAKDLTTQAQIVASNSTAALVFQDDRAAAEILSALTVKEAIVCAAIYSKD